MNSYHFLYNFLKNNNKLQFLLDELKSFKLKSGYLLNKKYKLIPLTNLNMFNNHSFKNLNFKKYIIYNQQSYYFSQLRIKKHLFLI
jgi:hypothetical protein